MAKLIVCGDSFSAVSSILPGTHYSEILANWLGWELHNYARRGCSNGGIRLQIQEAIKQSADFVIIVPTGWDRIEIPADSVPYESYGTHTSWAHPLQDHLLDTKKSIGYDANIGLNNINYTNQSKSTMISETLYTLAENIEHEYRAGPVSKEVQNATKMYINYLYDSRWKRQIDKWIIIEGCCQLHSRNIKFSLEPGMLWEQHPTTQIREDVPNIIGDDYIRLDCNHHVSRGVWLNPLKDRNNDPGYHGDPKSQIYIAEYYYNIIKKLWGL